MGMVSTVISSAVATATGTASGSGRSLSVVVNRASTILPKLPASGTNLTFSLMEGVDSGQSTFVALIALKDVVVFTPPVGVPRHRPASTLPSFVVADGIWYNVDTTRDRVMRNEDGRSNIKYNIYIYIFLVRRERGCEDRVGLYFPTLPCTCPRNITVSASRPFPRAVASYAVQTISSYAVQQTTHPKLLSRLCYKLRRVPHQSLSSVKQIIGKGGRGGREGGEEKERPQKLRVKELSTNRSNRRRILRLLGASSVYISPVTKTFACRLSIYSSRLVPSKGISIPYSRLRPGPGVLEIWPHFASVAARAVVWLEIYP